MMNEIILIGGGGHCKSVIDVIEQEGRFTIAGIVDKPELFGTDILGYKIIANDSELKELAKNYQYALVTVGQIKSSFNRLKLYDLALKSGFILPSIISPSSYISRHSSIGNGVVIMHSVVINSDTIVGNNCIINSKALIEHDCQISHHCHISTNATINGGVIVESESFIGSGAIISQSVRVQKGSFIKAGCIVK